MGSPELRVQVSSNLIYGQLPLRLATTKLSTIAKLLYAVLYTLPFRRDNEVSTATLASECSCSVSALRAALRELEQAGWLKTQHYKGRCSTYTLQSPASTPRHQEAGVRQEAADPHHQAAGGRRVAAGGTPPGGGVDPQEKPYNQIEGDLEKLQSTTRTRATAAPGAPSLQAATLPDPGAAAPDPAPDAASKAPGRPVEAPAGWEGWAALAARATGRWWAWTRTQALAARELARVIPPEALPGWQLRFARADFPKSRSLDLAIGLRHPNEYMPTVPAAPPAAAPAPAPAPVVTGADLVRAYREEMQRGSSEGGAPCA